MHPVPLEPSFTAARSEAQRRRALLVGGVATAIIPINFIVIMSGGGRSLGMFTVLALAQLVLGVWAVVLALRYRAAAPGRGLGMALGFGLVGLGGPVGLGLVFMALAAAGLGGGAWGRPLRVRGRIVHPDLRLGSDWSRGAAPDVRGLDAASRRALEVLWLHDAQKEHASVPAFARLSWLLAAGGAPADLLEAAHRAALEEIDHARRCFALAAGYGGRTHTAEPMPDLLLAGLELRDDLWVHLAVESVRDGCLLEDYNADIAAACSAVCEDAAAGKVLAQIAREERSHAELSWRIIEVAIERGGAAVRRALASTAEDLARVPRPTAVARDKQPIIDAADVGALRRHGRILDGEWAPLWAPRVAATRDRLADALEVYAPAA
jgi:hypothetical protein